MFHRLLSVRGVAAVFGLLMLSAAAYGFAASNTVPETGAGDGEGDISGYAISDVAYTLNGTDPTIIDTVAFTLDADTGVTPPAPTDVQVQLESSGGTWFDCTPSVAGSIPDTFTCDLTSSPVNVADADSLRVVAAQ